MTDRSEISPVWLASVIVTCFNDGNFLLEALNNLLVEKDCELIVVDDGSTDQHTIEIINGLDPTRVKVIRKENGGTSSARNAGIMAASCKYFIPLDADNKISPEYYRKGVKAMEADTQIGVVYSDCILFGMKSGHRETGELSVAKMLTGNYIDACAVLRKSTWEDCGGYDESLPHSLYEDWELWLKIISKGWMFQYLPEELFQYRVREDSKNVTAFDPHKRKEVLRYIIGRHEKLFESHKSEVISELHGIISHWEKNYHAEFLHLRGILTEEEARLKKFYHEERQSVIAHFEDHIRNISAEHATREKQIGDMLTESVGKLEVLKTDMEVLGIENKDLTAQVSYLEQSSVRMKEELEHYNDAIIQLNELARTLESRIAIMEQTKTWRFRKLYYKTRNILRFSGRGKGVFGGGFLKKVFFFFSRNGRKLLRKFFKRIFKHLYLWLEDLPVRIIYGNNELALNDETSPYSIWRARNIPGESELLTYKKNVSELSYKPFFSIILPVYNTPSGYLRECLDSVLGQVYENFEVCIADDCSTNPEVRKILEEYKKRDYRFKTLFRKKNGHIAECSNSALEIATGEFCVFLDHDDQLTQDCLYHIALALNANSDTDVLYSDEDKLDRDGRLTDPYFKMQWSPESFLTRNYLGHVVALRKQLIEAVGGFRTGFEGAQDYDLLLRITEQTKRILHIPRVLYHWRIHEASTAGVEAAKPYAHIAGRKALMDALSRRDEPGTVEILPGYRGYAVRLQLQKKGKVSILIPTKDNSEVLKQCIESIYQRSTWADFEIIVVSNNSTQASLFKTLKEFQSLHDNFQWFECNVPFNFSRLMNEAASRAGGSYYVLLNNDTEVISPNWMQEMMAQAQRPEIGAVGVKLLYPNDHIQHAGVVIGLGGVAGHIFTGFYKEAPGYFNYIHSVMNYSAVTAACLMVRADAFHKVGGFNEELSVEYNDTDFCLKLIKIGLRNVYLPFVELYHYESLTRGHPFSTKENYKRHLKEVELFTSRWKSFVEDDPCYSPHLSRTAADARIMI